MHPEIIESPSTAQSAELLQCFQDFVAQRLESVAGSPNTNFFFQLELNDFGQIGSNPIQMLRRSVPGYSKINELPAGSLLTDQ